MRRCVFVWILMSGVSSIVTAKLDAAPQLSFGTPGIVDEVSFPSPGVDVEPHVSPDGLSLYYCSSEYPGAEFEVGDLYLYVSQRAMVEDNWGPPTPLPPHINQGMSCGPHLSADGTTLYFNQGASTDGLSGEIYEVTRPSIDLPWGAPELMGDVFNEGPSNLSPYISSNGLEMYFTSTRSGSLGEWDLWVSQRQSVEDDWGPASHLNAPVNSSAGDVGAELSPDGRWLFFASDRSGNWDLWVSHRRTRTAPWEAPARLPSRVNRGGDVWPNMSSDSSTLYYATTFQGETGLDIWQVPVDPLPPMGDYDDDGALSGVDIDELNSQVRLATGDLSYDVTEDRLLNADDRDFWVHELAQTYLGDSNLDGQFNSSDLIAVLSAGTYEADFDAGWSSGDFDGSGRFDSGDLVVALADGGYEAGPRTTVGAVPEPSTLVNFLIALIVAASASNRCRK